MELKLAPPQFSTECNSVRGEVICCLPIGFTFGTINFIMTKINQQDYTTTDSFAGGGFLIAKNCL